VIGAGGGVGVHTVAVARALGARVVAIEREPKKLSLLAGMGCDVVCSPGDDRDWGARLRADVSRPVDVCVDTVASSSTLTAAVGLVGRAGTVIVVGFQAGSGIDLDPRPLVLDEVAITGSRYATRAEIIATLDLVALHQVEPVIGARYPLRDVAEAYRAMQENDVFGRIVVDVAADPLRQR